MNGNISSIHKGEGKLEGIIADQIIDQMEINRIFRVKQFRLETIHCEFMEAFDKVSHQKLIYNTEIAGGSSWVD